MSRLIISSSTCKSPFIVFSQPGHPPQRSGYIEHSYEVERFRFYSGSE
ncbi:unnamed protein product [Nyctereutes procyonoides]|uniref:(raccoon dog) hypothetical protein n=1 Tax=Nyctereutes procyonoides TaxID=34880 RepID=A0A811XWW6_NYCPR|nr:unnamed protein product [Nyctereutes procyonoides]